MLQLSQPGGTLGPDWRRLDHVNRRKLLICCQCQVSRTGVKVRLPVCDEGSVVRYYLHSLLHKEASQSAPPTITRIKEKLNNWTEL